MVGTGAGGKRGSKKGERTGTVGGWRQSDGNKGIRNRKTYEKNGGQGSRKTTGERLGIVNFRCTVASLLAYKYLE